jgi:hypothetical protein
MNASAIREILKLAERPGTLSLAGGLPSAATFPVEAVREATARVLRDAPREALQYAASEGFARRCASGSRPGWRATGSTSTLRMSSSRPARSRGSTSSPRC